jgi:hypothetical protein
MMYSVSARHQEGHCIARSANCMLFQMFVLHCLTQLCTLHYRIVLKGKVMKAKPPKEPQDEGEQPDNAVIPPLARAAAAVGNTISRDAKRVGSIASEVEDDYDNDDIDIDDDQDCEEVCVY